MKKKFMATINEAIDNGSEIEITIGCEGKSHVELTIIPEYVVTNGNMMTIYYNTEQMSFLIDKIVYDEVEEGFCIYDNGLCLFFFVAV